MQQGPGHKDGPFRPSSGGSRWDDASKWRGSWLQVACVMAPGSLGHVFRWRGSWLRAVWIMAPGAPSHKQINYPPRWAPGPKPPEAKGPVAGFRNGPSSRSRAKKVEPATAFRSAAWGSLASGPSHPRDRKTFRAPASFTAQKKRPRQAGSANRGTGDTSGRSVRELPWISRVVGWFRLRFPIVCRGSLPSTLPGICQAFAEHLAKPSAHPGDASRGPVKAREGAFLRAALAVPTATRRHGGHGPELHTGGGLGVPERVKACVRALWKPCSSVGAVSDSYFHPGQGRMRMGHPGERSAARRKRLGNANETSQPLLRFRGVP